MVPRGGLRSGSPVGWSGCNPPIHPETLRWVAFRSAPLTHPTRLVLMNRGLRIKQSGPVAGGLIRSRASISSSELPMVTTFVAPFTAFSVLYAIQPLRRGMMVKNGRTSAHIVSAMRKSGAENISIEQASAHPSSPRLDQACSINASAASMTRNTNEIPTIGCDVQFKRCDARNTRVVRRGSGTPKSAKIASTLGTARPRITRKRHQT